MNRFEHIDPILIDWGRRNALHLYRECQETAVRGFIVDKGAEKNLDMVVEPTADSRYEISVKNRKKRLAYREIKIISSIEDLAKNLDEALKIVRSW